MQELHFSLFFLTVVWCALAYPVFSAGFSTFLGSPFHFSVAMHQQKTASQDKQYIL